MKKRNDFFKMGRLAPVGKSAPPKDEPKRATKKAQESTSAKFPRVSDSDAKSDRPKVWQRKDNGGDFEPRGRRPGKFGDNDKKIGGRNVSGRSPSFSREKKSPDRPKNHLENKFNQNEETRSRPFQSDRRERGRPSFRKFDDERKGFRDSPLREPAKRTPANPATPFDDDDRVVRKGDDHEKTPEGLIRLNRYIANSGISSRREADALIAAGEISVNGHVVTEMGHKVRLGDVVKYGNKIINPEKMVYILLNKPKDYLTTTDDPEDRKTVLDLVAGAFTERIYPVGRLDRNTTGLLLLTNDGDLADKLTHPSNEVKKVYQAELDKPLDLKDFDTLKQGLELEDGFIKPDDLAIVTPDAYVVGVEIHSGRNRIVRRMFEAVGYEVKKLDRTTFAGLNKKELPRGKWRLLTEKEIIRLKFLSP